MKAGIRLFIGISAIVALLSSCRIAQAQTPAGSLPTLSQSIGERIEVVNEDGSVISGQLIRASEASLLLQVGKTQTEVALPQIRQISRWENDSVSNGAFLGALIGIGAGVLIGANIDTDEPIMTYLVLSGLGVGLTAGAVGDAAIKTKVRLFPGTTSRLTIAPILTGGRKGVAVKLSF